MRIELSYEKVVDRLDALKAVGVTDVHVPDGEEPPWHVAEDCHTSCSEDGIASSFWFTGKDPQTGLEFSWAMRLDPKDPPSWAAVVGHALARLPDTARAVLRHELGQAALTCQRYADQHAQAAEKYTASAGVLLDASRA